jgi:hypothetical protein
MRHRTWLFHEKQPASPSFPLRPLFATLPPSLLSWNARADGDRMQEIHDLQ